MLALNSVLQRSGLCNITLFFCSIKNQVTNFEYVWGMYRSKNRWKEAASSSKYTFRNSRDYISYNYIVNIDFDSWSIIDCAYQNIFVNTFNVCYYNLRCLRCCISRRFCCTYFLGDCLSWYVICIPLLLHIVIVMSPL